MIKIIRFISRMWKLMLVIIIIAMIPTVLQLIKTMQGLSVEEVFQILLKVFAFTKKIFAAVN